MQETVLKIDDTMVELIEYEAGRGRINVTTKTDSYSHFWGAMGSDMVSFVAKINQSYFLTKLNPRSKGTFCPRKTLANVRAFVKTEIPWYECQKEQKRLRQELKELEKLEYADEDTFMRLLGRLSTDEKDDFGYKDMIERLSSEPWHLFGYRMSEQDTVLVKTFKKLQTRLRRMASV